jgi:hypothetical protein
MDRGGTKQARFFAYLVKERVRKRAEFKWFPPNQSKPRGIPDSSHLSFPGCCCRPPQVPMKPEIGE